MRIAQLSVTPVKSLAVNHPAQIDLVAGGIDGDRVFYLVDDEGEIVNCTAVGDLLRYRAEFDAASGILDVYGPDGLLKSGAVDAGDRVDTSFYGLRSVPGYVIPEWSELFSSIGGGSLRLVRGESGGFDVAGVTLLGSESVSELARRNGADAVDPQRFRMNIEIAESDSLDEDTWEGRELQVGSARLRVGGPVKRCAATTRNTTTGVVDLKTLEMIGKVKGRQVTEKWGAGFYFGVYADVLTPGRVSVGDTVLVGDDR